MEFRLLPPPEEVPELPPGGELVEQGLDDLRGEYGEYLGAVAEARVAKELGIERPYLMIDVEQRSQYRLDSCLRMRDVLANLAKEDWQRDMKPSENTLQELPSLFSGKECRSALQAAQYSAADCCSIITQLQADLAGKE